MANLLRADVIFVPSGPELVIFGLIGLIMIACIVALAVAAVVLIVRLFRKKKPDESRGGGRPKPPDTQGGIS